jgi:4,5-dihydroxyphthalate decarboxylase
VATKLPLTLTCGDYEITRPLAEGLVEPDGIALTVLTDPASRDRHWRLARNAECDLGEFNACAYFMARERGHPYIALPIYPHRRFRHGFVFVNTGKGITSAAALRGRRIGCFGGFQPAALRLAARHPGGVLRPAASRRDLGAAARRRNSLHAATGLEN